MKIGIVGLGLIGGSLAKALKFHTDHTVLGWNRTAEVALKAKLLGAIDGDLTDEEIADCDLLICALYPQMTIDFVLKYAPTLKKGAIVLDACGVKRVICEPLMAAAKEYGFVFYGGHPMAGLHKSGFSYTNVDMFKNASMILVPPDDADIEQLAMLKDLFLSVGFTNIQMTTAEEHDRIIAYTSQLAHIVSNAYVKSPEAQVHSGFSAGSYKDLTRVAELNADMWTELFLENDDNLLFEVETIIANLQAYADALKNRDADTLHTLLKAGSDRKQQIDGKG